MARWRDVDAHVNLAILICRVQDAICLVLYRKCTATDVDYANAMIAANVSPQTVLVFSRVVDCQDYRRCQSQCFLLFPFLRACVPGHSCLHCLLPSNSETLPQKVDSSYSSSSLCFRTSTASTPFDRRIFTIDASHCRVPSRVVSEREAHLALQIVRPTRPGALAWAGERATCLEHFTSRNHLPHPSH